MADWAAVLAKISERTGEQTSLSAVRPVSGGCINRAAVLESGRQRYFVKHNHSSRLGMFIAEAEGLSALQAAASVRVPTPICWGVSGEAAFLVLEYLELAPLSAAAQEILGRQLAALHRVTQPQFGWHRDNTIGTTLQINTYAERWPAFFRDARLGVQLRLAGVNGYHKLTAKGDELMARMDAFFDGHAPRPSLLHGDLWSGNVGATAGGQPVIFDPAVYFGDRECDLAMTELFGGFSRTFYAAYAEAWPLAPGYETRRTLYNLYHVLNHLNLFGPSYLAQAERMLAQLLAEVR